MTYRIALPLLALLAAVGCSGRDATAPIAPVTTDSPAATFATNSANAGNATVEATIIGGGTAIMDDGMGTTAWGGNIKLLDDGSATGELHCVDKHGSAPGYPGNIWGKAISWSPGIDGLITVTFVGQLVGFPGGHPQDISFQVTFQRFGGAGVGHWTLAVPNGAGGWFTVCFETLTSGQVVFRKE
jgi:hypothetical protein